jgi:hypothetical protein
MDRQIGFFWFVWSFMSVRVKVTRDETIESTVYHSTLPHLPLDLKVGKRHLDPCRRRRRRRVQARPSSGAGHARGLFTSVFPSRLLFTHNSSQRNLRAEIQHNDPLSITANSLAVI